MALGSAAGRAVQRGEERDVGHVLARHVHSGGKALHLTLMRTHYTRYPARRLR